ncbi:MAG TPA: cytochrome c biogenesis protein CcdA [Pirellulaceae bacterium]|jgi:thiol:disulfide interchange protein
MATIINVVSKVAITLRVMSPSGCHWHPASVLSAFLVTLSATIALAQAPPGVESAAEPPKLNLFSKITGGAPGGEGEQVKLSGSFNVNKATRRGALTVAATIEPSWHIYSLTQPAGGPQKSELKVTKSPDFSLLGIFQADRQAHVKPPSVFKVNSEEHDGVVNWSVPIEVHEGVDPESLKIEVTYSGQVCKDGPGGLCIPIFGEKFTAKFAGFETSAATAGEYRPDPKDAQIVLNGHIEPAAAARGGKAKLVIAATPNPGWHIYALAQKDPDVVGAGKPTLIYLAPIPGWQQSGVKASATPKTKSPLVAGLPTESFHDDPVTWSIDLSISRDAPQGETLLTGYIGFQTCNSGGCLRPQAVQFRASLPIKTATEPGQIPLEFKPATGGYNEVSKLVATAPVATREMNLKSLLPIIGFGLLGGLILNLMPCVLPVIGLKILSFVQHGGQSRATIFALNFWFALGLLSVFMVLATAAAFANLGWGQQFTYTWFKVAMVIVVFSFALSFLGVWEVPIPGFAETKASNSLQKQEGASGAFFKGIFTTLLATPCSGPFLGPVFAYTLTQPPLATYIIFGSVGLGMASPYLITGIFPALVRWLPKPGAWMETVKELMAFVLLGTVVYLFSTLSHEYFIPTLATVIGVWLACWLIGQVPVYEDFGKQARQWILGLASAAAIGWLSFTFLSPEKHLYEWQPYSPETIAKLQADGKTVMVDFTAEWCLTCKLNFKTAINTRRVKEFVERNGVAPVLADWTDHNDAIKSKLEELQSISIPLLAIYPANKPGDVIVLRDRISQSQLLSALEEAGPSTEAKPAQHQISSLNSPASANSQ